MKGFARFGFLDWPSSVTLFINKSRFCHILAGPQQRVYQETSRLTSRLVINGLRVEDAGRYKCELGPLDSTMQLNVRGKPKCYNCNITRTPKERYISGLVINELCVAEAGQYKCEVGPLDLTRLLNGRSPNVTIVTYPLGKCIFPTRKLKGRTCCG